MHSNTEDSFEVRAVNFAILLNDSCTKVIEYDSHFVTIWSQLINRIFEQKNLAIEHDGHTYNRRWLMGNGYAGMPGTKKLILPRRSEPPIQVLEVTFSSKCDFPVHFEGESPMNQVGDVNLNPIKWIVEWVKWKRDAWGDILKIPL